MTEHAVPARDFKTLPHFRFTACTAGDIYFDVVTADGEVSLRADSVFDPFPDLIGWLEAMTTGVQECRFDWRACDPDFRMEYFRQLPADGLVRIFVNSEDELLAFNAPKRDIIEGFYRSLMAFIASPMFDIAQWHAISLHESLQRILDNADDRENIVERLAAWPTPALEGLLESISDVVFAGLPESGCESIRRALRKNDSAHFSPDGKGGFWQMPDGYEALRQKDRYVPLSNLLSRPATLQWFGTDLRLLRSPLIERWLQCPEESGR